MDQSAEKHSPRPLTPPQTSCSSKHIAITVVVAFTTAVLTSYGTSMLISSQNTHIANPQLTTKLEIIPSATPALTPADALSNWKTVSSKEVGIVFKYPGDKLPYIGMSEVPNASYFGFSAFNHPEKHNPLALTEEN